ncbi:hypothetical protein Heshes_09890 [Alicyclobacillus hesperidum]|uniref:histidine kinase n=1 Tax=Alicyclobacillus hesperidum TaxID=89784 RepID=A0AA37U454_9BACL|nr:HAMP domain-containing sensor histidine kinase [Alicyclobacillus hesperidum]GLV13305.1 hypothetical protein Heshes_09890 [Alicyclobacillus hesperidum]
MFRRMYVTISGLLIMSTGLLLVLLGIVVYHELQSDLVRDGELAMENSVPAVEAALARSAYREGEGPPVRDSLGNSIYYYAVGSSAEIAHSPHAPVPFEVIHGVAVLRKFATFAYNGEPYRLYTLTVPDPDALPSDVVETAYNPLASPSKTTVVLYMYSLITQERSMLHHTLRLMEVVGGAGFLLAVAGDLVLARRLVQPAFRTWSAYNESVLELSHELQTPIATANAMLASRGVDPHTAADIRRELERASKMVSDILYLSKLRSGVADQPTEPVAVSDITNELADRFTAVAAGVGIAVSGAADEGLFVETTAGEWERLISTLFKNVIDHAARPSTASWSLYGEGRRIVFLVENAVGSRVDGDRRQAPERGVGLKIVERLAQRMRGAARIETTTSRFLVEINVPALRPH